MAADASVQLRVAHAKARRRARVRSAALGEADLLRRSKVARLLRLLDEMPRRNADQQQQCTNDRRRADDLHALALRLRADDRVGKSAGANEIYPLDRAHVDWNRMTALAKDDELGKLQIRRSR